MPPDDNWTRISTLLDAVLDLSPAARAAYLDEACADAPEIRAEVEALLDAEANAPSFLDDDAAGLATPLVADEDATDEDAEEHIGPYRIVRTLGRGGMSVVYLAERADGHFRQQVALKLLPRYLETETRVARFRAERQILATLDHPNIAHLLDGGVTETGRPYLVMEHVEGQPITDYCTAHDLPVEARLKLLLAACRAVQHAHRRLVVHRDLKPSNILVTETAEGPRVKLLDFGIAKLLADNDVTWTTPVTRTGEHWMTPEYAAPEQVRGDTITTATDVYQFGVLAYEVLTGQSPFDLEDKSLTEIERILLETDPERPSKRVEGPPGRTRRLQGDLDTIVLKALRKEPERRYASAQELADDLERYLDGLPVTARPATWRHRTRQFVRRHRGIVVTTTLVVLLLVGYAVTVTVQAQRIAAERDRAEQQTAKAEQVSDFLMNLFAASDPNETRGDTVTARELLIRGIERAEALDDQPEVQAEMRSVIGRVYMQLGLYEKATPLFEQALDVRRARYAEGPPSALLAGSLHNLGSNHQVLGHYDQAEALYREALPIWRALPDAERTNMVRTLNNLAGILRMRDDDDAASIQRETLTMARQLLGDEDPTVAFALGNLAEIYHHQGQYERADSLYRAGWTLGQRVLGETHPHLLSARSSQAELYRETGDLERAETMQRAVLDIRQARYPDHTVRIGLSQTALGHTLRAQNKYEEAETVYRTALDNLQPSLPDAHVYIADALMGLGATLTERGAAAEAESLLRRSLAIYSNLQPDGWQLAEVKSELGRCLGRQGRYAEAEPLLLDGYATLEQKRGADDGYTRQAAEHLAQLYDAWDKPTQAARYAPTDENG